MAHYVDSKGCRDPDVIACVPQPILRFLETGPLHRCTTENTTVTGGYAGVGIVAGHGTSPTLRHSA